VHVVVSDARGLPTVSSPPTLTCCTSLLQTGIFSINLLWLLVVLDIVCDGYGVGRNVPLALALLASLCVGAKLHNTCWHLTCKAFQRHDVDGSQHLAGDEVRHLQHPRRQSSMASQIMVRALASDRLFWFNRPHLLVRIIKAVMFQGTLEIAMLLFYKWQRGYGSCDFYGTHGTVAILRGLVGGALLLHSALVTLPSYTLAVQMGASASVACVVFAPCCGTIKHQEEGRAPRPSLASLSTVSAAGIAVSVAVVSGALPHADVRLFC
jgi:hypothetical protein